MSEAPTAAASEAEQIAQVAAGLLEPNADAAELLPDTDLVPPMVPSSPEVPAAPPVQEADTTTFSFDVDIPEDIQFDLEDDSEDDEDLHAHATEMVGTDPEPGEYEDPEVTALRRRALAAEKKAAFLEAQKVKTSRKAWEAEAAKFFPLCDPTSIQATSRRAFRRAAQAQHEQMKPHAERIRAQVEAEARTAAAAAWGKPQGGGPQVPSESVESSRQVERGFEQRGLAGGIKEMLRTGNLRL